MTLGDNVLLRVAPHGPPGEIVALPNRWCVVHWKDLKVETKHRPEQLVLVGQ